MSDKPTSWPFPTGRRTDQTPAKPTVYLFTDEDAISLSAYPVAAEEWETNHISVVEANRQFYAPAVTNLLRNVLEQAGITVVLE